MKKHLFRFSFRAPWNNSSNIASGIYGPPEMLNRAGKVKKEDTIGSGDDIYDKQEISGKAGPDDKEEAQ
ncbi:MAG: hypothetical protein J6O50_07075 [Ruminiclostridium sp.]|nr:hypothetical protein [Ruminiclostridium sp.]